MSEDHTRDDTTDGAAPPEANGSAAARAAANRTELAKLRAHVAKLRHWCRALLADPAAVGVLADELAADLRATPPAMSEEEAMDLFLRFGKGESVPPTHPAFAASAGIDLSTLAAERERLRQAFFTLYDHLHPDDNLTDEYFAEMISEGPLVPMEDVLAELEREYLCSGERGP